MTSRLNLLWFALLGAALAGCSSAPRRQSDFTMVQEADTVVVEPSETAPAIPTAPAPVPAPTPASATAPIQAPERAATRPPASSQPNRFTETWIPLERWSRASGYGAPQRVSAEAPPAYTIGISNNVLQLRVGSRTAYWNGMEFLLGFAPQIVNGQPCVHALDVRKNFEPLISPHVAALKPNGVIVLDPGHGGTDTGANSVFNGHFEKEFTLDLARRLQRRLATNGWTILLTRNDDLNLALSNRVNFAEQHKADLFLSLHFNSAAPDREQAGLETYCLTPAGMPSNLTRGYQDYPGLSFPNNGYDSQNLEYAARLHRAVLKVNGRLDRGVRRARFLGVLQNQNRPAVLVECGYLSNPREARQIADPNYREKLAEALASAVVGNSPAGISLASQPTAAVAIKEEKTN